MKSKVLVSLSIVVMISLLLNSCSNIPTTITPTPINIGDGGLISGRPCSAPCFFGNIPGITSRSEVIEKLKQNQVYLDCSGLSCPGFVIYTDDLTSICESISYNLTDTVTIADVIEKFGNPDLWGVVPVNEYSHEIIDPETVWLSINYNSLHMVVNLESQEVHNREYILSPDTKVESVMYLSSETYHYSGQMAWPSYGNFEVPY